MMRSLSWSMRFAIAVSIVFATGAVLTGSIAYVLQAGELKNRLNTDVQAMALGLAQETSPDDLKEQIAVQLSVATKGELVLAYLDNQTQQVTGNLQGFTPFSGFQQIKATDVVLRGVSADQAPEGYYAFGMPLPNGWLVVGKDDAWVVEAGEIMFRTTAWSLFAALFFTVGFAFFIARRNEIRILQIEEVLSDVGSGNHERRIAVTGSDDLTRLSEGINKTFDQIEAGIDAIQQVSTDVAHDLRAPLSRLRIRLEQQVFDPDMPDATKQELGSALIEIDGISETFDAILRLSRLQSGAVSPAFEEVDLGELCDEVQEILTPIAEDAGHTLLLTKGTTVSVRADRNLLMQALINMIDNAIRHCPAPAEITIYCEGAKFGVRDTGPGIPENMRDRVLQRFVRLDQSRNTAGSGIGLSLVAAIARIHDAELHIDDAKPGVDIGIAL